jgi:hypothetical protein
MRKIAQSGCGVPEAESNPGSGPSFLQNHGHAQKVEDVAALKIQRQFFKKHF